MHPIYLDYAATTPLDPRVGAKMAAHLLQDGVFGNPASQHCYGIAAREAVEMARHQVAETIGAEPSEIIWTSGATESNNLAIKGAAQLYNRKGKHIVTMRTEHKAVLDTCQHLEKQGFSVTYLTPASNGLLDIETLTAALRDDTILVSIMHVNNETGTVQNIEAIGHLLRERQILFHVDAAQSIGKVAIDINQMPVDLLSLSAHKVYGPKGIGALYLRKKPRVRVEPLIHGGGHEQGMRSGTLAPHQIVGMGEAFALAQQNMQTDNARIRLLHETFMMQIETIPNLHRNADSAFAVPHIINVRFEGMLADAILKEIPLIAASTASACQGKGTEGSYVLRALGLTEEQAKSSIRFSFGRMTTEEQVMAAATAILQRFGL